MVPQSKVFRLTLASHDVPRFLDACQTAEWYAFDTGERVMTDDGPDAEAVLLVEPVARATAMPAALVAQ
jgi:hypothetical protein